MPRYEYKVIPAPEKAGKHKGLKGAARFAATLEQVMNEMGAEGWHYLRADILPHTERSGLTATQTTYRTLLVFSRALTDSDDATFEDAQTAALPAPDAPRDEHPDADDDTRADLSTLFEASDTQQRAGLDRDSDPAATRR